MKKGALLLMGVIIIIGLLLFVKFASYIPVIFELFFKKEITLRKTQDRVNVLLLGIGGGGHEGPLLTDTIIYASIDPQNKRVTMVSIPRDLWVPDLSAKINTSYAFAQEKQKGSGLVLTKAIIENILHQPVDYAVRIDFNGFVKAVDMIGGLDIIVDTSFDDYEYPIPGKEEDKCGFEGEEFDKRATDSSQLEAFPCRYEHLHFDKGLRHMNGETALRFVRSRHALGPEGTDFARSKRQEKVISSFKERVFSLGTFLNPIKLVSLESIFKESIDTDIKQSEYDDFVKLAKSMRDATINSIVLDYGDETQERPGLLINPPITEEYHNQWVIIPRTGNGNFKEIQDHISCVIKGDTCPITPTVTL